MPRRDDIRKILIIGSGPIIIGQACEFDYSGTQACKALKKLGYEIVLVNSNPATIMTDPAMADVTYIEPLNVASLTEIIAKERPDALLPNLGGQTGLNLSFALAREGVLEKHGVRVIGRTNVQNTPAGKASLHDDSYIRKTAIRHKVPYITTTAAAIATAKGISAHRQGHTDVRSLQQYHAGIAV
jgi:hypothetical protein